MGPLVHHAARDLERRSGLNDEFTPRVQGELSADQESAPGPHGKLRCGHVGCSPSAQFQAGVGGNGEKAWTALEFKNAVGVWRSRSRSKCRVGRLQAEPVQNMQGGQEPITISIECGFSKEVTWWNRTLSEVKLAQDERDVGGIDFTVGFIDFTEVNSIEWRTCDQLRCRKASPRRGDPQGAARRNKTVQGLVIIGFYGRDLQGPRQGHVLQCNIECLYKLTQ